MARIHLLFGVLFGAYGSIRDNLHSFLHGTFSVTQNKHAYTPVNENEELPHEQNIRTNTTGFPLAAIRFQSAVNYYEIYSVLMGPPTK